jgi:hypothetical protein
MDHGQINQLHDINWSALDHCILCSPITHAFTVCGDVDISLVPGSITLPYAYTNPIIDSGSSL